MSKLDEIKLWLIMYLIVYGEYLLLNEELMKSLPELKGKILGCWCAPLACHGEVLAELANKSD